MKKAIALLCLLAMMTLMMTACVNDGPSAPSATPEASQATGGDAATADPETPSEADTGKEYVIGYASKSSTTPFWVQLNAAIQSAAADLGVTVKELGPPKENDAAGQIAVIEDFWVQGVDALIVAPCDDVGVAPAVQKFLDEGKPVITVDNGVSGVDVTATVATDNLASAGAAATYIVDTIGPDAKVVTIDGIVAQGTGKDRKDGFVNQLAEASGGSAEVVNSIASDWVDDTALKGIEDLLNAGLEFDAIFAAWDGGALAAYQALKSAGREDIIIVGHDAFEQSCDLMIAADPIFKASVAQNPVNMGTLAVQAAVDALSGQTIDKAIDSGYELVTGDNAQAYKDTNYA